MEVSVKQLEQASYITNAVTGDYTVQMWRQFGAPDPDGDYVWFIGANATQSLALNMARNQDPELDAALNTQRASNGPGHPPGRLEDHPGAPDRRPALPVAQPPAVGHGRGQHRPGPRRRHPARRLAVRRASSVAS